MDLAMNKFMGNEQQGDFDFGLKRYHDQLPKDFQENMENLYKLGNFKILIQSSPGVCVEFIYFGKL